MSVIDFSSLGNQVGESNTNPIELFSTLLNKKYDRLRPGQQEVLKDWATKRKINRDIAIQMNTGSGKTLVGLLIAYSCLLEHQNPSVYLTPNRALAEQVAEEARCNGIPVTMEPGDTNFLSGSHILIATVQKLFNGKSVFEHLDSGHFPLHCGCIVIDDCHSAIQILKNQFTLRIPQGSLTYQKLLALFSDDLKVEDPIKMEALLQESGYCSFLPLSLVAYFSKIDKVISVLSSSELLEVDDDYRFTFPLISKSLKFASATFSSKYIELIPRCPDVNFIQSYARSDHRIFLSATFSGLDELTTELDADINRDSVISPSSASDCGDRLIIAPRNISTQINDEDICAMVKGLTAKSNCEFINGPINASVLVPSRRRAQFWHENTGGTNCRQKQYRLDRSTVVRW